MIRAVLVLGVARLNQAMVKAPRSADVSERMQQIGFDVVASTPEEFVQKGGIKPD